jgi:hypothetical protein
MNAYKWGSGIESEYLGQECRAQTLSATFEGIVQKLRTSRKGGKGPHRVTSVNEYPRLRLLQLNQTH